MLWADGDIGNGPWWAGGTGAVFAVGYGVVKLYRYLRDQTAESRAWRDKLAQQSRQLLTEEQKEARKNAAAEAVPVVERLSKEVETQAREICELREQVAEIQQRERDCSEERAGDKVLLVILVGWARVQPNPPPIPPDVLARFGGSGPHAPLTEGSGS